MAQIQQHLQFMEKFAECISETFKQFADTLRKERDKQQTQIQNSQNQAQQIQKKPIGPPPLKLLANNPLISNNGANNLNGKPNHPRPSPYLQNQQNQQRKVNPIISLPKPNLQASRPQNAFSLFVSEERKKILQLNPQLQFIAVTQQVTQIWKNMSQEQKRPYIQKYQQLKKTQFAQKQNSGPNPSKLVILSSNEQQNQKVANQIQQKETEHEESDDDCFDDILPQSERIKKQQIKNKKLRQKQQLLKQKIIQKANQIMSNHADKTNQNQQIKEIESNLIVTQQDLKLLNNELQQGKQQIIDQIPIIQQKETSVIIHKKVQQINNFEDLLNNNIIIEGQPNNSIRDKIILQSESQYQYQVQEKSKVDQNLIRTQEAEQKDNENIIEQSTKQVQNFQIDSNQIHAIPSQSLQNGTPQFNLNNSVSPQVLTTNKISLISQQSNVFTQDKTGLPFNYEDINFSQLPNENLSNTKINQNQSQKAQ